MFAVLGAVLGINNWARSVERDTCYSFASQSNREVKFVSYTQWSWDCLTPSKDGKWISVEMLRDITDQ